MLPPKVLLLVVDDAPDNRDMLTCLLEREGYAVEQYQNGQEALERLAHGPTPCLVLLDLMMPVMDGWTFLERKACDHSLDSVPVLVLSADASLKTTLEGRDIAGYLQKPLSLDAIVAAVGQHYAR